MRRSSFMPARAIVLLGGLLCCVCFAGVYAVTCAVTTTAQLQCDVISIKNDVDALGQQGYQLSGRNITIRGDCVNESGQRPCILDAVNNNRHFVVSQTMGEAVVFRDLAFVNGSLDQEGTDYSVGGAVYVQGRAVFERCSFLHNKASSTGGAVYLYGGKTLSVTFRNCSFQGNEVWRAPYLEGPAFYNDGGECYMNAYNDIQEHGFGPITRPCHKIDS